jgi:hypothetical protein
LASLNAAYAEPRQTTVELLTVRPRTVDHSAHRIFACAACNFVPWIPDSAATLERSGVERR